MIKNKRRAIPNFFIALCLVAGISWVGGKFIHLSNVEFTDNAQIKQHLTPVNTRVQGFIKKIYFDEYQNVKKGDTLVVIEDIEYQLRVAQAEADLQNALTGKDVMHTTINTTHNNILVTDAAIEEQRIRLKNAETDYKRYLELVKQEAVTPQQFDRVQTEYEATKAKYEQLLRQKESASLVRVDVSRRIRDPKGTTEPDVIGQNFSFGLKDGFVVDGEAGFELQPYDLVVVRRSPSYNEQMNVTVDGEVLYRGDYTLNTKSERLSSLIQRAGGAR